MTEEKPASSEIRVQKTTILTILVGITLIISLINTYGIFATGRGSITGNIVAAPSVPSAPSAPSAPTRVSVSADDDPVIGNPNAPVTIIEFSDFECPFCGRFFEQTLPTLKQKYIDTGKVKIVYRDFPLSFHSNAQKAAEAGECAKEQGKFVELHDAIFANQQAISVADLKATATRLGLNSAQFDTCVDSGKYAAEVQADEADGAAAGVSGTPSFFIGTPERGYQLVVGAQPTAVFEAAIEQELSA